MILNGGIFMSELVTLGETMVLFTPAHSGKMKNAHLLLKSIGGAESNVAIGVARLGHSVSWMSRVGNDPFGHEILYRLNAEQVDTSKVFVDDQLPTGLMFKERIRDDVSRVYYYRTNSAAASISPDDINEQSIKEAKVLHITGITPALSKSGLETVLHAISLAKKHNVNVSFDPNLRLKLWTIEQARNILLPIATQSDFFFPGLQEAKLLLNEKDLGADEAISAFLEMGVSRIILKLGTEGCITADQSQSIFSKGFKVKEVDSVGAGDGFCAGYLVGVLKGWNHDRCAQLANGVGALAVTEVGDYDALPTFEEVEEFIGLRDVVSR